MHASAADFIKRARKEIEVVYGDSVVNGFAVAEIGSRNINGRASDAWGDHLQWVGIDIAPGYGVDIVGHGAEVLRDLYEVGESFDMTVSCEVFEHTADWAEIMDAMKLTSELALITCAGEGRTPHSAVDGMRVRPDEYYSNITNEAFSRTVRAQSWRVLLLEHHQSIGDLYALLAR